jgi:prepilin-type N-terminal cleavage/methylation domain-containing protein
MNRRTSQPTKGFTLIEVVISLGIFALAIVALVSSLGISSEFSGSEARRVRGTEILHGCFRDLSFVQGSTTAPSPALAIAPIAWGTKPVQVRLWFDHAGKRVPAEAEAYFKCDLTATRDPTGKLGHLHGRVVWPAVQKKGRPDGEVELFTSLMLP